MVDKNNELSQHSLWIIILEKAYAKFKKTFEKGNFKCDYDYLNVYGYFRSVIMHLSSS